MHKPTEEERKMWSSQILDVFKKAEVDIGIDLEPGDIIVEIKEEDIDMEDISDSLDKKLGFTRYDSGGGLAPHILFDRNKITRNNLLRIIKIASEKYGISIGRGTPEFGKLLLKGIEDDGTKKRRSIK